MDLYRFISIYMRFNVFIYVFYLFICVFDVFICILETHVFQSKHDTLYTASVRGAFSDFSFSTSSKTPSAGKHTKRCASKSQYYCCNFRAKLWHESQVMAKTVPKPSFLREIMVSPLLLYFNQIDDLLFRQNN